MIGGIKEEKDTKTRNLSYLTLGLSLSFASFSYLLSGCTAREENNNKNFSQTNIVFDLDTLKKHNTNTKTLEGILINESCSVDQTVSSVYVDINKDCIDKIDEEKLFQQRMNKRLADFLKELYDIDHFKSLYKTTQKKINEQYGNDEGSYCSAGSRIFLENLVSLINKKDKDLASYLRKRCEGKGLLNRGENVHAWDKYFIYQQKPFEDSFPIKIVFSEYKKSSSYETARKEIMKKNRNAIVNNLNKTKKEFNKEGLNFFELCYMNDLKKMGSKINFNKIKEEQAKKYNDLISEINSRYNLGLNKIAQRIVNHISIEINLDDIIIYANTMGKDLTKDPPLERYLVMN